MDSYKEKQDNLHAEREKVKTAGRGIARKAENLTMEKRSSP
jgi:hypothetical protein